MLYEVITMIVASHAHLSIKLLPAHPQKPVQFCFCWVFKVDGIHRFGIPLFFLDDARGPFKPYDQRIELRPGRDSLQCLHFQEKLDEINGGIRRRTQDGIHDRNNFV